MSLLLQDLRFALRMLRKNAAFSTVCILTLSLGIGVNSAIFSVVDAVLLRPLPFREPDRVLTIYPDYSDVNMRGATSPLNLIDYRRESSSFSHIAATAPGSATITGAGEAERVKALRVTADFFAALGIDALHGRTFAPEEDQAGHEQVVVVGHGFWQGRLGGDPRVLGSTLEVNGQPKTIIGIMPAGFTWGYSYGKEAKADIWLPLVFSAAALAPEQRGNQFLDVYARLKPGVTVEQAQRDIDAINLNLQRIYPVYYPKTGPPRNAVRLIQDELTRTVRPALMLLLATVGCVLLIACSNVANLLMARASARQKEIAIRTALGASPGRVIRQMLTESCVLALISGVLGTLLGVWCVQALSASSTLAVPRLTTVALDVRVFLFSLAISLLTGLLFGAAPALQLFKVDVNEWLKDRFYSSMSRSRKGVRELLVVGQIAVALLLLAGAGLLINSFYHVLRVDPGFQIEHVLTARVDLPRARYQTPEQKDLFFQRIRSEIAGTPGVSAVGAIGELPLSGGMNSGSFEIEGRPSAGGEEEPLADWSEATPGYFEAMNIPIVAGQAFTDEHRANTPSVVVISQGLARKFFPEQDPLGKRIDFMGSPGKPAWSTIIGVVPDIKHRGLDDRDRPQFYAPFRQTAFNSGLTIVTRTKVDPASVARSIRATIQRIDPQLAIYDVRTMEEVAASSVAERRLTTLLLASFAGLALLLACIGLYGVIAYSVAQRTQEIGIRMALGAQGSDVLRMVLAEGARLTVGGLLLGGLAVALLTHFISSLLFQVRPADPLTLIFVAILLALVALLASYLPARRAARVNPIIALRYE
jgi:putative ABC transport system permease protein